MQKIPSRARSIQLDTSELATVTGGTSELEKLVDDNATRTAERFRLVQSGALDREDFNFFLQNQRRDAKVVADVQRARSR